MKFPGIAFQTFSEGAYPRNTLGFGLGKRQSWSDSQLDPPLMIDIIVKIAIIVPITIIVIIIVFISTLINFVRVIINIVATHKTL